MFGDERYPYKNIISYNVYIDKNSKPRLVEHAFKKSVLKKVQSKIHIYLSQIDLPQYLFSKKGSSSIKNAKYHIKNSEFVKVDISSFFPNSHRDYVYDFFLSKMQCSPDVSRILTDLTTINLKNQIIHNANNDVYQFIKDKRIRTLNHLPTGSSTSPILCFHIFYDMFEEIYEIAYSRNYLMSIYVDDITFSSPTKIDKGFIKGISRVVSTYNHKLSIEKTKYYTKNQHKEITGVIITKYHRIRPKSKIHRDVIYDFKKILSAKFSKSEINSISGKINYAKTIDRNLFPNIYEYVRDIVKKKNH